MNLILELRNNIRKIIKEAIQKQHFQDRVYDRLLGNFTNFNTQEKEEIKKRVFDDIEYLTSINFSGQSNIGVNLGKGTINYKYQNDIRTPKELSQGAYVWVVIRGNDLETIVFGDANYRPANTQMHLKIENIKEYIEKQKNNQKNLNEKDLNKINAKKIEKIEFKKSPDLPTLNVNGVKYVFDKNKEIVYKKNDPEKKQNIWDFIQNLDAENQDKIYDILEENTKKYKKIF